MCSRGEKGHTMKCTGFDIFVNCNRMNATLLKYSILKHSEFDKNILEPTAKKN